MLVTGEVSNQTISAALADPLSIFSARSPGARAPGALTQSKPMRVAAVDRPGGIGGGEEPAGPVTERVLPGVRTRPVGPPIIAAPPPGLVLPGVAGPGGGTLVDNPGGGIVGGVPGFGGGGGIGGPIGGGGGGFIPTNPVSPVPEPATWLTLIAGMFAIGSALRSRRARLRAGKLVRAADDAR